MNAVLSLRATRRLIRIEKTRVEALLEIIDPARTSTPEELEKIDAVLLLMIVAFFALTGGISLAYNLFFA